MPCSGCHERRQMISSAVENLRKGNYRHVQAIMTDVSKSLRRDLAGDPFGLPIRADQQQKENNK